jgi:hypothetical protein
MTTEKILGGPVGYQHGCLSVAFMALVPLLLLELMAVCRPAPSQVEEDHDNDPSSSAIPTKTKSVTRWWWELQHKGLGDLLLLLIFVTIWLGTSMEGTCPYLIGYVGIEFVIALLLCVILLGIRNPKRRRYPQNTEQEQEDPKEARQRAYRAARTPCIECRPPKWHIEQREHHG